MKNKIKIGLIIVAVFALVLIIGCVKDKCGDGVCQRWEEKRESCPEDCELTPIVLPVGESLKVKSISILRESGGRVSWLEEKKLIVYDQINRDGYTDIFVMNDDGTNERCLTCNKEVVPQMNNGNPEFHTTGKFILFQSEDPALERPIGPSRLIEYIGSPGVGINNNIWLMNYEGTKFWQLTHVKDLHGALHPHFSRDGTKLVWSELTEPVIGIGQWEIKIADFMISLGIPTLKNIQSIKPLNLQLFELDDFTRDNKKILFSGSPQGGYYYDLEKYIYDIESGQTSRLTNNKEWDEQAHFINNDSQFVWVSSIDNPQPKPDNLMGTIKNPPLLDYWIMNSDGTGLNRITGFNDPTSEDYIKSEGGIGLGDFVISEDGKTIIGKMRQDWKDAIVRIELE